MNGVASAAVVPLKCTKQHEAAAQAHHNRKLRRLRERGVKYLHKKGMLMAKEQQAFEHSELKCYQSGVVAWRLVNVESQKTNDLVVRSLYQKYNEISNDFLCIFFSSCKTFPLRKQTKSRVKKFLI